MAPSRVTLASAQNPDPVKIRIQFHQKKTPSDSNFRPVGNPVYAELWHSLKEIASGILLDRSRTGRHQRSVAYGMLAKRLPHSASALYFSVVLHFVGKVSGLAKVCRLPGR